MHRKDIKFVIFQIKILNLQQIINTIITKQDKSTRQDELLEGCSRHPDPFWHNPSHPVSCRARVAKKAVRNGTESTSKEIFSC